LPNFYFYDINGKFTYLPTEKDIISISFYEGRDYLGEEKTFDFPSDTIGVDQVKTNERTRWGNNGLSGKWLHRWSEKLTTQLFLSDTKYLSNHLLNSYWSLDASITPVYLSQDKNQIIDQTSRINVTYNTGKNHLIEVGLAKTIYKTDYSLDLGDSIIFINEKIKGSLIEGYVQDRWIVSPNMELLLGLRSEKFSKGNTIFIDPRLSVSYHISDRLSLKVSGSRAHQFLNRFSNDVITNGSKFVWLIPNKHMGPMGSIQKIFGLEYDSPDIFFGFDLYNKNVSNISDFSQFVFPIDVYSESSNNLTFQGEGQSNGFELFFHKKKGKLKGWASYNYGTIQCKFPELNGGEVFLADHDRTHEMKSALISSIGKWTLTITGLISSGRVFTPNNNLMIRENENANYTLQAEPGTKNSNRLPIVQRVDLSLNRSMYFMEKNVDIGISIFNVFNRKNISHRSYNLFIDPFISTDVIMLGFTPTISMKLGL
jgi:outer membrane receptor for ferrienterochelin and colicin